MLGKKLIDQGIKQVPNLYRYWACKIKNKNIQRALNSDIANYVVEKTQNKAKNILTNLFGGILKNEQGNQGLTNALKNMNDEDINDNFVGVLPLIS